MSVHPSSVIESGAQIDPTAEIGPFCHIGPQVVIGAGTVVKGHSVINGNTSIGKNNTIFQFCSIGEVPQDLSYKGEDTRVIIGDNNVFREYVSVHRATLKENLVTTIGNNGLFMAHVHIGHDAVVGNKVILVNSCNIAGHVKLGDNCIVGGGTNIGQFVSLGRGAYIGGASGIDKDIPPFCTAYGNRVQLKGINIIGLKRMGKGRQMISEFVDFYRTMETSSFSARTFVDNAELMNEYVNNELVLEVAQFIRKSEIGIAQFYN